MLAAHVCGPVNDSSLSKRFQLIIADNVAGSRISDLIV